MAAYELLGSKWPVVSIKSGAAGGARDVKNSLEFLESFDTVVICFDSDTAGKDGARGSSEDHPSHHPWCRDSSSVSA